MTGATAMGVTSSAWRARFRRAPFSFPRWAADRPQRLVYTAPRSGTWQVYARDLETGTERLVTGTPSGTPAGYIDPAGAWIWWFGDRSGDERGVWWRAPFDGGDPEPVPGRPAYQAGLVLGRGCALIGESQAGGTTIRAVGEGRAPAVLYQDSGQARVTGLSACERFASVQHAERGDARNPALAVINMRGSRVGECDDGEGRALWAGPWSPVPGDERLIVQHERDGALRPSVWAPLTGDWTDVRLGHDGETRASWFPDGQRLLLHQRWHGRSSLYSYRLADGALAPIRFPPGDIEEAAVRPDATVWALHSGGGSVPRLVADGIDEVWPAPGRGLPGRPYQDLWAGDVHCFLAEPPAPRPHPVIFVLHGGPARQDSDSFSARVQAWVDHGFAAVLVNYHGSTGYGRRWRDALLDEPGPGHTELADLASVRRFLIEAGIAQADRVVLEGGSWGGYLTLLALGRQPGLWQAGIAVVPVADWEATFSDELPAVQAADRALFGGSPAERPAYYAERSPITWVKEISAPVMIVRGINDQHCPRRQIDNYVSALEQYGKMYEFHEFDGGHGTLDVAEEIAQHALQVSFLRRHLGTSDVLG
jgi:dienelactone hydrolase